MLIPVVLKPCMLCHNLASPTKVKLICRGAFAFGRESAVNRNFAIQLEKSTAGKRMPSIVHSSLVRHIVHPFWIAMLAPSCGAAK
jgi:hypothetical protein